MLVASVPVAGERMNDPREPMKGRQGCPTSTLDLDKTRDFYENTLGFKTVRCDVIEVREGGQMAQPAHRLH